MRRKLTGVFLLLGLSAFVAGCDLERLWYELCPEPHVATASTADLIAELIDRGVSSLTDE